MNGKDNNIMTAYKPTTRDRRQLDKEFEKVELDPSFQAMTYEDKVKIKKIIEDLFWDAKARNKKNK